MNKPIEELIQRLKEPDYKYYGCELSRGEAELAISALEKQISKKPIRVSNNRTDGCPKCKTEYYEKFKYCPECGIKLDWSVEDE